MPTENEPTPQYPPSGEIAISHKRDAAWFAAQPVYPRPAYEVREEMSAMVEQNAQELFGSGIATHWEEVSGYIHASPGGNRTYTGKRAIVHSLSHTLLAVIKRHQWSGESPEVVYMSAYHYTWALGKEWSVLTTRLHAAEEGKRQFVSPEMEAATLAKEKAEAGRLEGYLHTMNSRLDAYVQQKLPQGAAYLKLLRFFLYGSDSINRQESEKIHTLFASGKIDEAHAILTKQDNKKEG